MHGHSRVSMRMRPSEPTATLIATPGSWAPVLGAAHFNAADARLLRTLFVHAQPRAAELAQRLHGQLLAQDGGNQTVPHAAALQRRFSTWLTAILCGPWDDDHYRRARLLGRAHVRARLLPRHLIAAMACIRDALEDIVLQIDRNPAKMLAPTLRALHRVLDVELAIMLEPLSEARSAKGRAQGRRPRASAPAPVSGASQYEEVVERTEALIASFTNDGRLVLFNRRCERMTGCAREAALGQRWQELCVPKAQHEQVASLLQQTRQGTRMGSFEALLPNLTDQHQARRVRWYLSILHGMDAPMLCALGFDITEEHKKSEPGAPLRTAGRDGRHGGGHRPRDPQPPQFGAPAAHAGAAAPWRGRRVPTCRGLWGRRTASRARSNAWPGWSTSFSSLPGPSRCRSARPIWPALPPMRWQELEPEAQAAAHHILLDTETAVLAQVDAERFKQVMVKPAAQMHWRRRAKARGSPWPSSSRPTRSAWTVSDDGPGIDGEAPVLEPFFTTKEGGTGLGLTVVQRIVNDHGGHLEFRQRSGPDGVLRCACHAAGPAAH